MQHAYYTNSGGTRWGVIADYCPMCNLPREKIQYLFFDCVFISRRWVEIDVIAHHSTLQSIVQVDLFGYLEKALHRQCRCPAQLILLTEILHVIWVEHNQVAWQGNYFRFPWDFVIHREIL